MQRTKWLPIMMLTSSFTSRWWPRWSKQRTDSCWKQKRRRKETREMLRGFSVKEMCLSRCEEIFISNSSCMPNETRIRNQSKLEWPKDNPFVFWSSIKKRRIWFYQLNWHSCKTVLCVTICPIHLLLWAAGKGLACDFLPYVVPRALICSYIEYNTRLYTRIIQMYNVCLEVHDIL